MNKEIRRLWIILAGAVALLALNALVASLGWSPFESIVQEQIRKQSEAADAISAERRKQLRNTDNAVKVTDSLRESQANKAHDYPETIWKQSTAEAEAEQFRQQQVKETTAITAPVAPEQPPKPVAPQMSPRPVAPLPPSYILYYPDGTVRYVSPPVYPDLNQ